MSLSLVVFLSHSSFLSRVFSLCLSTLSPSPPSFNLSLSLSLTRCLSDSLTRSLPPWLPLTHSLSRARALSLSLSSSHSLNKFPLCLLSLSLVIRLREMFSFTHALPPLSPRHCVPPSLSHLLSLLFLHSRSHTITPLHSFSLSFVVPLTRLSLLLSLSLLLRLKLPTQPSQPSHCCSWHMQRCVHTHSDLFGNLWLLRECERDNE